MGDLEREIAGFRCYNAKWGDEQGDSSWRGGRKVSTEGTAEEGQITARLFDRSSRNPMILCLPKVKFSVYF